MSATPNLPAEVNRGLLEYAHWIYALYALALLMALGSTHAVALRFVSGLPSIIAVVMGYARRSQARGTWLGSHFRWQIHTFWYAWLWIIVTSIVAFPLAIVLVGIAIEVVGLAVIAVWVIYRIVRGWLALRAGHPVPVPV